MLVNHFRTLLLNRDGPLVPDGTLPGDEYVPPFRAIALPGYLAAIRTRLFGSDPDWPMMRYRLRQFLPVVHASPLVDYALALDPRFTYDLDAADFVSATLFAPAVHQTAGTAQDVLTVVGAPAAPDVSGRMYRSYTVQPTGGGAVIVTTRQPPIRGQAVDFTPGDRVPLPGSGYSFRLTTDNPGASWMVEILNRPQADPGQVTASLDLVGEAVLVSLFGASPAGPYATFAGLWYDQRETPLRLAAILLATAYRTEERRLAGA